MQLFLFAVKIHDSCSVGWDISLHWIQLCYLTIYLDLLGFGESQVTSREGLCLSRLLISIVSIEINDYVTHPHSMFFKFTGSSFEIARETFVVLL